MNNLLRKWSYLNLILMLGIFAIVIIQIIFGGRTLFNQNVFYGIIISLDGVITSWIFVSMPRTGAVGDERTIGALEKASLYAFLILVGCLILLSGAYFFGGINSFLLATKESYLTPIIAAHIGIYSWGILAYYFVKKGE
jgi:uncharacterized membrane protein (GlpM family)